MQNTFASAGTPAGIAEAVRTIDSMRKHAGSGRAHVFFTQHGYLNGTSCDGHAEYKRFNDARGDTTQCERDVRFTKDWELIPSLPSPLPTEPIVQKEQYDAFFETSLHAMLQERGVNTVVLAGWETDVCVEGTARGAFSRDYRVVVLSDATGTSDGDGIQAAALRIMEKVVADVMTAANFRAALDRTLPPIPPTSQKRPCDIYGGAGSPCVAAHSTVRTLFASYAGPLYDVQRADGATQAIKAVGGFADAASQDTFCEGSSSCIITRIYDQTARRNHLAVAPAGGAHAAADRGANASAYPLTVSGHRVYGAFFEHGTGPGATHSGTGYRNDNASGVATGDAPETIYMVTSGRRFNSGCCFDYGNAETDNHDEGKGTMEAVYWGSWNASRSGWSGGVGSGPWVMADLENGLWAGSQVPTNPQNVPISADFVTAMAKGKPGGLALKGGDSQAGQLRTLYEGKRPPGYEVMKKQGAIILGIGGDNSDGAEGIFFEGVITAGYSSDEADDAVQAEIVAAGYGR